MKLYSLVIAFLTIFFFLIHDDVISCEPEKYPPAPEILWPPDQATSIPIDSAIIVKDFKSISNPPPKLEIELRDNSGNEVKYKVKNFQSRRSVYNYEGRFMLLKPVNDLNPMQEYSLSVRASQGFAQPINMEIKFVTGDKNTLATAPEKLEFSYYISQPGYYLSNCQTSTWDKATSLFFMNSKVEGYPLLLVLDSNLLKDVSFFHSSMKKRDLALLFLPNEKGVEQCFELDAYAINGEKVFNDKYCKPKACTNGRHLSKEEAQDKYDKLGAFGFSLIEFPAPKNALPEFCAPYPPLCRAYWSEIPSDSCTKIN